MTDVPAVILASSSPYRRELLDRLELTYIAVSPDIDETPLPGESAADLVTRLAEAKARAVAASGHRGIIIGSDQVASLSGRILTKPGTHERAVEQLQAMRGRTLVFMTGLCVLDTTQESCERVREDYEVVFREYSDEEIDRYLRREQPYDCAGSFKSERLGVTLMAAMRGPDPTALIGLPLIRLTELLRNRGLELP